jgi:hypothetical protein
VHQGRGSLVVDETLERSPLVRADASEARSGENELLR